MEELFRFSARLWHFLYQIQFSLEIDSAWFLLIKGHILSVLFSSWNSEAVTVNEVFQMSYSLVTHQISKNTTCHWVLYFCLYLFHLACLMVFFFSVCCFCFCFLQSFTKGLASHPLNHQPSIYIYSCSVVLRPYSWILRVTIVPILWWEVILSLNFL